MLIQQVARPYGALFVQSALGFGSAEPRPIGFRLFRRLFSLAAFLKSFEVDHVSHAGLPSTDKSEVCGIFTEA
jgi:hypothetical protein